MACSNVAGEPFIEHDGDGHRRATGRLVAGRDHPAEVTTDLAAPLLLRVVGELLPVCAA